jgi:uncharacterized protein DUF3455
MQSHLLIGLALLLPACSGSDPNGSGAAQGELADTVAQDLSANHADVDGERRPHCPESWVDPPAVDPSIAVPADGGDVLLHAAAVGTQNYTCKQGSDGGFGWSFVGPEADLQSCKGRLIGRHFASDGGPGAPEWQTNNGALVIAHRIGAFTPDGGAASIPWLLLQATGHGGTGALSEAAYVQRTNTDGGTAPAAPCNAGTTQKVPYTADYYFYGP